MRNLLNFLLKYDYWLLFILLEAVSFTLLFRFNNYQGSVYFTSASGMVAWVDQMVSGVTSYFGLREVNTDLTRRNVQLELEVERLSRSLRAYVRDSAAIEQIRREAADAYWVTSARVVNNSLTRSDNYITIDKGSADSVCAEMGVLSGSSVVGVVYHVSRHYALVLPVLNSKSNISCKIRRTDYFGVLKWEGGSSRYAWLQDIPRHSEFSLGDTVVTSGHSAIFPEGVPVGVVDDREDSHDGLSYHLKIRLFTDFARLSDVSVIRYEGHAEQAALEDSVKVSK
ncbi:rod shape-determining protein MreC [Bacteroides gallinaceum]|uniref:rod shape-determining protein MreC n=1 Tax=Bacteroides gallinaceum TaxID=1462571 RepID=UPI0015ACD7E3|nr:rod shape-determining protein MreC [Bacteroides gallinaceum]MDM8155015.1 rod shape-determining protein MreC [Bacteroides gallinaceum]